MDHPNPSTRFGTMKHGLSFGTAIPSLDGGSNAPGEFMAPETIGEVIATRTFYLVDDLNSAGVVSVFVGRPQVADDQSGYRCPFQIIGLGTQNTQFACGHDAIHALQSAMILIAARVNHLNNEVGGRLRWEGGRNGDLGFP